MEKIHEYDKNQAENLFKIFRYFRVFFVDLM